MLYICKECQVIIDTEHLKKPQCPIITPHINPHKPLLSVDDDMADPVLRCLKKNYFIVHHRGAHRRWSDEGIKLGRLHSKIPYLTIGFINREECFDFYDKFKHLNHTMTDWNIPGLQQFYRSGDDIQVISNHILRSCTSHRNSFTVVSDKRLSEEFYEIRFVGGGPKFSPLFVWEQLHFRDLTEEQNAAMGILHKDFYDNYFDYCKDFFCALEEICA